MNDRNSYVIIPAVEFIRIGDVYVTKDYFHISYTLLVKLGLIREVELNDSIFEAIMGSF